MESEVLHTLFNIQTLSETSIELPSTAHNGTMVYPLTKGCCHGLSLTIYKYSLSPLFVYLFKKKFEPLAVKL